jgi:hypothetical protein
MRRRLIACALVASAWPAPGGAQPVSSGTPATGDAAVVALVHEGDEIVCTASVIAPHTAITAAHCVVGLEARRLRVFVGSALGDGGTFIAVSHARSHPGFSPGGRDVAMLTLREPAPVTPLALELAALDASIIGTIIRVVGFGITGPGLDDAGVKREGTARIVALRAEELIAVPEPSLACLGDSGGPALLATGEILGVVSRSDVGCRDHAAYTRLDLAATSFIEPYLADTAPGTALVGEPCFYAGHCDGGHCLQTEDDPLLHFCSRACTRDADCPEAMRCASDGCRYPVPSPGALGAPCTASSDCTSGLCIEAVCTRRCGGATSECPAGYACHGSGENALCFAATSGCLGCGSGAGTPGTLLLALAVLAGVLVTWRPSVVRARVRLRRGGAFRLRAGDARRGHRLRVGRAVSLGRAQGPVQRPDRRRQG